jgi:hypothetical protein
MLLLSSPEPRIELQGNPYFRLFCGGAVDLNTDLRKILNEGNLTPKILNWDH